MKANRPRKVARPAAIVSRRDFLVTSTAALVAGTLSPGKIQAGDSQDTIKLAIKGGEKAVKKNPKLAIRWGEPERERLNSMLGQESLFYWKGPQTTLFTDRFKQVCPLKYVMPCSSGTAALHIAVTAAGIGPGDEVITSPITDIGTVIGVLYQQGVPVFADLGPGTYN